MRRVSILFALLLVIAFSGAIRVRTQAATPPILVVVNTGAPNPFSGYLAEILRAEGINSFQVAQLSATTSSSLANFRLVVLAETPLTLSQATTFSDYVAGGGRLITMRPDAKLLPALGLSAAGNSTTEGYLSINAGSATGAGFPVTTLPFHGTATNFVADAGATTLATLYSNQTTPTAYPAVVQSGRTVTWAYDLARSVLYTRQGDPGNAGVDRDGLEPIRTNDIFYNWIDKDRVYIPHADIQMRLFARAITDLLADTLPLPRLWYFPNGVRTLFIVTADSHANPGSYFDKEVNALNARGVKGSFYTFYGSEPSPATIQTWRNQGHEFGMHPAAFQKGWTYQQAYQTNYEWFNLIGYGTPSPTARMHQAEWLGWVDAAKVAANYGVSMDTSFMTWGPAIIYPDGHQPHGYINGSGQPMRFMDETGAIVPVWQIATSLVDEQLMIGQANGAEFTENLTTEQSLAVARQIIDASQAGDYAAVVANFHVDDFGEMLDVQAFELGTIDYVNSLGIPNRTAERFLAYTTARAATTMTGMLWAPAPRQLSFTASVPAGSEAQSVALPGVYDGFGLTSVTIDGTARAVTQQTITGRVTKFVSVSPGTHALTATYTSPISAPENPPVAQPDSASTTVGVPVTISVLANDSDPDSDPLTVTGVVQGVLGTASINANQTVTFTPAASQCGTGTFTYNISDGRGGTASATVTVTIVCPSGGGQRTQTQATDFGLPPAGTGAIVTLVGDGEVRLAGLQGDEYSTASLNSALWTAGTWSGGALTPAVTGGVLSLGNAAGAYVRSTSILPVTTVEFTARFTGATWEHIGWGDLDFAGGSYLLFSTFNTADTLFVRSALSGAEQRTSLGPIPTGFHTYRIDRLTASPTTNTISYYIDGVFQAQHTIGVVPAMYVYQSQHSGSATPTLDIDRIWVYPQHVSTGNFVSPPMDSGGAATWTLASWNATVPAGTTLDLRTRTSADATSWSPWSSPLTVSGQGIQSPANRYLQYQIEMTTADPNSSPVVNSVTMAYDTGTGTGQLSLSPTTWNAPAAGGTQAVTVTASPSTLAWTASSSAAWLTVTPTSGTGSASVTLTAASTTSLTSRTGTVTLGGQTVSVTQAGGTVTLSPTTWNPPAAGGTQAVTVTATSSTLAWTASSSAAWLTVSPTSGTGSASVTLTAVSTTSFTNRTGTVTLGGKTVSVTQAGGTVTLSPTTWNPPAAGGTLVVTVTASPSTVAWTASDNASWLTASPAIGSGSGSVTLTAAAINGKKSRSATATIGGQTVAVTQTRN